MYSLRALTLLGMKSIEGFNLHDYANIVNAALISAVVQMYIFRFPNIVNKLIFGIRAPVPFLVLRPLCQLRVVQMELGKWLTSPRTMASICTGYPSAGNT